MCSDCYLRGRHMKPPLPVLLARMPRDEVANGRTDRQVFAAGLDGVVGLTGAVRAVSELEEEEGVGCPLHSLAWHPYACPRDLPAPHPFHFTV